MLITTIGFYHFISITCTCDNILRSKKKIFIPSFIFQQTERTWICYKLQFIHNVNVFIFTIGVKGSHKIFSHLKRHLLDRGAFKIGIFLLFLTDKHSNGHHKFPVLNPWFTIHAFERLYTIRKTLYRRVVDGAGFHFFITFLFWNFFVGIKSVPLWFVNGQIIFSPVYFLTMRF